MFQTYGSVMNLALELVHVLVRWNIGLGGLVSYDYIDATTEWAHLGSETNGGNSTLR